MKMTAKPLKNGKDSPKVEYREIAGDEAGQRLDNFLLRIMKGVPKSRIYRAIRRGEVRVDGGRVSPPRKLRAGEVVRLPPLRRAEETTRKVPTASHRAIIDCLIYEDDRLLAINKPAGMAAHGGSGVSFGAIELMRGARPELPYLELVHRLDRATSGCLLFAKRRSALRAMHELMRGNDVEKRYRTLLAGTLTGASVRVDAPLLTHQRRGGERVAMVAAGDGKRALSIFEPDESFDGATLATVRIETGRTHQIRVHAAHIGHPVLGDDKYGDRGANQRFRSFGLRRMFLHASSLRFARPGDGRLLQIDAPLAPELVAVLDRLKNARR